MSPLAWLGAAVGGLYLFTRGEKKQIKAKKPPRSTVAGISIVDAATCSIELTEQGDDNLGGLLINHSQRRFEVYPPPAGNAERLMVDALTQALPSCPWPPTNSEWRLHGDSGDVQTWGQTIDFVEGYFESDRRA